MGAIYVLWLRQVKRYWRSKARIVGARALQISFGAPILVDKPKNLIDPIKIAQLELKSAILPLTIRRELPDGTFQDIPINKLILKKD